MKAVAVIQARMGSSRLPGKVLFDLAGEPMLARVHNRVSRSYRVDEVVVATSRDKKDDAIAGLAARYGWNVHRGDEFDVLDRFYHAARESGAEVVCRVTADCPFADPGIIDEALAVFSTSGRELAYVATGIPPRTYPRGIGAEVFHIDALVKAWNQAKDPESREHVTPYLRRHPEMFTQLRMAAPRDYSSYRWTVDTTEDYQFASKIYGHFGSDDFRWTDVLDLLKENPEWQAINKHVRQKNVQ